MVKYGVSNASIQCSFRDNQSLYCLVCCSTDPTAPPNSSVYNISSTRGTEVTVDLDGLTSGQTYYCKAAATNINSSPYNCTFPGFGGVSVFVSFTTMLAIHDTQDTGKTPVDIITCIINNSHAHAYYRYCGCCMFLT